MRNWIYKEVKLRVVLGLCLLGVTSSGTRKICIKPYIAHNSRVTVYDHGILEILCCQGSKNAERRLHNGLCSKKECSAIYKCWLKSGILATLWKWEVFSKLSPCSSQGQLMWLQKPCCSVKHAWRSYILCKCISQCSFKEIPYWIGFSTSHVHILERLMDPSLKRSQLFRCHAWRHTMNWSLRKFSHAERTENNGLTLLMTQTMLAKLLSLTVWFIVAEQALIFQT